MDGMVLGFFLLAAFLGAVTTGVAGFAMGLVVSGIWLHILTPVQTVTLMVSYSVLLQGYGVWKLRHALSWRRVAPFIIGGVIGVPIGAMLLAHINPAHLRTGVGLLLLLYSIYYLARPVLEPVQGGVPADIVIGFLNGVLGGLTGLVGIVVVIWCQLRGWPKDVQRTVFQPVIITTSAMTATTSMTRHRAVSTAMKAQTLLVSEPKTARTAGPRTTTSASRGRSCARSCRRPTATTWSAISPAP